MLDTLLITLLIVAVCLVLLAVKVLFVKGGKFPNGHISSSKALRDKGIGCAQSQDREARKKRKATFKNMEQTLDM